MHVGSTYQHTTHGTLDFCIKFLSKPQLPVALTCSMFEPKGLCQLLAGGGMWYKQLTKTFGLKHPAIEFSLTVVVLLRNVLSVNYQHKYAFDSTESHLLCIISKRWMT